MDFPKIAQHSLEVRHRQRPRLDVCDHAAAEIDFRQPERLGEANDTQHRRVGSLNDPAKLTATDARSFRKQALRETELRAGLHDEISQLAVKTLRQAGRLRAYIQGVKRASLYRLSRIFAAEELNEIEGP